MEHAPAGRSGPDRLLVVAVSKDNDFLDAVHAAIAAVTSGSGRVLRSGRSTPSAPGGPAAYAEVVRRARRYLDRALPEAEVCLIADASLPAAVRRAAAVAARPAARRALALVVLDTAGADMTLAPLDRGVERLLDGVAAALPDGVQAEISPYTTLVYGAPADDGVHVGHGYVLRHPPEEPWVLTADVVCAFTDFVQVRHSPLAGRLAAAAPERTLGRALVDFLTAEAGSTWGLHYYTGSMVSGLIHDLEQLARDGGNPVLRGPSEHSLACGALARWQLDQAPFLIVVTSGMIDEFRGALADLRQAEARGFIVCGDSAAGRWFPFQGTVHADEDAREVLRARRLPALYLDSPQRLGSDLTAAFTAYAAGEGPVVLLATPAVLDMNAPATAEPIRWPARPRARSVVVGDEAFESAVRILNTGDCTLLWQCGHLNAEEADLVHAMAREAGAGLADSLTRPGPVARYRDGRLVEEYLGTLGLYGYSARVHDYLHRDGRLKPRDEQCLFFLKSRISEIATPFSERVLARALRIVQVTHRPEHLAPFADHAIVADLYGFLRAVRDRLEVRPDVLRRRRAALRATTDSAADVVGTLPLRPMAANYFFRQLGLLLDRLITTEGYEYTGVFDVGRGGLSAVRNLPRTGPGFSGWYGRALMGNALQAIPALAVTRPGNILAFVGDGAAALVPDIVPTLVQQVCLGEARLTGNLSIFRLIDGGHSLIRTYREARQSAPAGYQTSLLGIVPENERRCFGPIDVVHRRLTDVDPDLLAAQLRQPATVNLYSVILGHNNEGDGLSLLASLGWQRDDLPELAFAGTPTAVRRSR